MEGMTPMMRQYMKIKDEHPYCLVFFRLGDFYELFFDDAVIASRELDLVLTGKDCGLPERAPMCGVPYHAAEGYIAKLIEKGFKVAVCEQTEDPKTTKTLVKRDVVRIVTPGTIVDQGVLEGGRNNFIVSIHAVNGRVGISAADVSTGDFFAFSIDQTSQRLDDELARFSPAEVVTEEGFFGTDVLLEQFKLMPSTLDKMHFEYNAARRELLSHFKTVTLEGFGVEGDHAGVCAAGGLLRYLRDTQKNDLSHITALKLYQNGDFLAIDASSRRNLELCETLRDKKKQGTLLWVLDKTKTAMGARMLRKWLAEPLTDPVKIETRLDAVSEIKNNAFLRADIRRILETVYDMERLLGRIAFGSAGGRDLLALKRSVEALPVLKEAVGPCASRMLKYFAHEMDTLPDIHDLINRSIDDEPPSGIREGGFIRGGYNAELDGYRAAKNEGAGWILELEARERAETGIKNLRIKYNRVFGYYLEVTKSNMKLAPERFLRLQTLAGCERYTTSELKGIEETILGADEKIVALEYNLFQDIIKRISAEIKRIQRAAGALAAIDAIQSLAEVADGYGYVRPKLNANGIINIKDGRHPVVERGQVQGFIPNDTLMNTTTDRLLTITGPNMAGKSTYMRQVALIVIMAQMGSFVPATEADIGVVDKIFTRVGASDDLATGQSTFMVEMSEVANILNNATPSSLIILDEIGRGTSTYDGMSIAWAVLEFIANKKGVGARTLFATHFHEMTELEGKIPGVVNYCVKVKESGDNIIFLRKIARGGADKSYGIHVAKLAGLPAGIINRAMEIMAALSDNDAYKRPRPATGDAADVVYYSTGKRKPPSGNRVTIEQPEDAVQLTIREIFKNLENEE